MKIFVTISGSFQKALDKIRNDIEEFESLDCTVLSPRMFRSSGNEDGFVILDSDGNRHPAVIHNRHLISIGQSDLLWVRNPSGYVGLSTALEIGYAYAIGVPAFSSEKIADSSINRYVKVIPSHSEAIQIVKKNMAKMRKTTQDSETDFQAAVAHMSAECGFDQEKDDEILSLLEKEIDELKEALAEGRVKPTERHSVAEELADCAIYLYHFANQTGITLREAIHKKIAINMNRWGGKHGAV